MSTNDDFLNDPSLTYYDTTNIPSIVAEQMVNTANKTAGLDPVQVDPVNLTNRIAEITVETQTMGAAILTITVIDPDWAILRSGMCDQDANGLLRNVDVEFPPLMDVWWRLAMVEFSSPDANTTGPNLTLSFQQRIISYLLADTGALGWKQLGGLGTTRAQFIKRLAARIPQAVPASDLGPGNNTLTFTCHETNDIQPVASSNLGGNEVITSQKADAQAAGINKLPLNAEYSSSLLTSDQDVFVTELANQTGLDSRVVAAWCLAEESGSAAQARQAASNNNWLNIGYFDSGPGAIAFSSAFRAPATGADQTAAFLKGTWGGASSGIRAILTSVSQSPSQQIAAIAGSGWASSGYDGGANLRSTYQELTGSRASTIASPSARFSPDALDVPTESDIAELTRGTPDNPSEDSWTCMQRLASEVNWMVWCVPYVAGTWGNFLYYMDGLSMVAQKPTLYITLSDDGTTWSATNPDTGKVITGGEDGMITNLSGTIDNTAFEAQETRVLSKQTNTGSSSKVAKKTRIRTPQTPTEVTFDMLAGVLEFSAGDVFVFHNAGPLSGNTTSGVGGGRWIVEDVTHNTLGDVFAQFTLGPPTYPYPEPQANTLTLLGPNGQPTTLGTGGSSTSAGDKGTTSATATASGAAGVAQQALARQKSGHMFHYQQLRPIQYEILSASPVHIDCSGFVIACYKNAGLPDPSGNNYNGEGYTGDIIPNCSRVTIGDAQPGDFIFYGPPPCLHVTIYIGNGKCISMGTEGDPSEGDWTAMGPCPPYGVFRSKFTKDTGSVGQTVQKVAGTIAGGREDVTARALNGIFKSIFDR